MNKKKIINKTMVDVNNGRDIFEVLRYADGAIKRYSAYIGEDLLGLRYKVAQIFIGKLEYQEEIIKGLNTLPYRSWLPYLIIEIARKSDMEIKLFEEKAKRVIDEKRVDDRKLMIFYEVYKEINRLLKNSETKALSIAHNLLMYAFKKYVESLNDKRYSQNMKLIKDYTFLWKLSEISGKYDDKFFYILNEKCDILIAYADILPEFMSNTVRLARRKRQKFLRGIV